MALFLMLTFQNWKLGGGGGNNSIVKWADWKREVLVFKDIWFYYQKIKYPYEEN